MITMWTGRCASKGMAWLGVLVGVLLVALTVYLQGEDLPAWALILTTALAVLLPAALIIAASLLVSVTPEALVVRWGPAHWPTRSIPWSDVTAVSVVTVEPMDWGGWGYRWAPGGRGTAAVVRRGPGIKLDLLKGRPFTVTVDDAEAGCAAASEALAKLSGR